MSEENTVLGETIAGMAVSQAVVLDILIETGVLTREQVLQHLRAAVDRMRASGLSENVMMTTQRLLDRAEIWKTELTENDPKQP